VKCAIAEKNATKERADFLKQLLEYNQFTVVVAPSPPPKVVPPKPAAAAASPGDAITETAAPIRAESLPPPVDTFTVGVTDVSFNPTNAIFGRLLKAPGGHIVTLAYWQQKENEPSDDIPYFELKK